MISQPKPNPGLKEVPLDKVKGHMGSGYKNDILMHLQMQRNV